MATNFKIYLLGANNRTTATLAEVYKKNNYTVSVISWHQNNIRHSKFVDQFILLPNVEENFTAFKKEFISIFSNVTDLIIPVNDIAVLICQQCEIELQNKVTVIGVNLPSVQHFAINKYALLQLALQCNIDCPPTKYITTLNELNKQADSLIFPIIAKPISSRLLSGNAVLGFQVKKFYTKDKLVDFVRENINTIPLMLQECLEEGYGIGFNFIAKNGELADYYFHQRLHEAWGGGESSYRKTITTDTFNIVPKAKALIKLMGWNGVGMIEFRVTNNKAYLMELNGRFWGSIKLGVFAGKNFPLQILDIENLKKNNTTNADKELYARNFKMEITWLLRGVMSQKKLHLPFVWCWNFRKAVRRNEIVEDNLFADFKYRLLDLLDIIKNPVQKKLVHYKLKKQQNALWKQMSGNNYTPKTGDAIVFVCKGNICRSPFAEMYARQHYPDYTFYSTGFINKTQRLPPIAAVAAAKKYTIDTSMHPSDNIYFINNKNIDAWFIMDKENLSALINILPDIDRDKIFSLGGGDEIADPFNKTATSFDAIFSKITMHLNGLFKINN